MSRLKRAIKKYGLRRTLVKLPDFARSQIRKFVLHPSVFTRSGISHSRWQKFQIKHELDFWRNPAKYAQPVAEKVDDSLPKYRYQLENRFRNVRLDFSGQTVIDVGCGPWGGFLPFVTAKTKIGLEPLAQEFRSLYPINPDIIMLPAMAENIPLLTESVATVYCVNMLDHTMRPYQALAEIYRILRVGGYLALSVDIGGTKGHPIKVYKKDLDTFFANHPFNVIEQECSTERSHWGKAAGIPVYTFQGYKAQK